MVYIGVKNNLGIIDKKMEMETTIMGLYYTGFGV